MAQIGEGGLKSPKSKGWRKGITRFAEQEQRFTN